MRKTLVEVQPRLSRMRWSWQEGYRLEHSLQALLLYSMSIPNFLSDLGTGAWKVVRVQSQERAVGAAAQMELQTNQTQSKL